MIMIFKQILCFAFAIHLVHTRTLPNQPNDQADQNVGDDNADDGVYQVGFGIGDITGPAAEINMMGYAKLDQNTKGIHMRLYSRAMILADQQGHSRICYVNVDLAGSAQSIKMLVLEELGKIFGHDVYTERNLLISATHTHSGPGGYFQYLLYIITAEGYIKESAEAIVSGVVLSIERAHNNLQPGRMYYSEGSLTDASISRSPASYLMNPEEERAQYKYNTDKTMQLLKFTDLNGKPLGMINWFAVHGVSMNNSNLLISGDNKGYAALTFEQDFNGYTNVGKGPFVAIFGQCNEGDVTPNTQGAKCLDTGKPCDFVHSTCNGKNELCVAFGPGKDMFESTKIIGQRQYSKAKELFDEASEPINGSIHYVYQNIDMAERVVTLDDDRQVKTCRAALGFAFAAGTTDGEGPSFFHQGTIHGNESPIFDFIRDFIKKPSEEMVECQKPKAVLLAVGEMNVPYDWTPSIMPTQMFEIGNLVIVALPGEFTTMSGRRIRNDVKNMYAKHGRNNVHVILAGLANTYSNYIATPEEYELQRYEGGSTLFGPHTLDAYRQQYKILAKQLVSRETVTAGPRMPNLISDQVTFKPGVVFDTSLRNGFGFAVQEPHQSYSIGERVQVKFSAADPRNNMRLEGTFLSVERLDKDDDWIQVATDAHWETMFIWTRKSVLLGTSEVEILWDIPQNAVPGKYRIRYFGDAKNVLGHIHEFVGTSSSFTVTSS